MDTLTRMRNTQRQIFKAQRRLVIAQTLVWPTVAVASLGAAAAAVLRYRSRDTGGVPTPVDGLPHL